MDKRRLLTGTIRLLSYTACSTMAMPLIAVCVGFSAGSYSAGFFWFTVLTAMVCGCLGGAASALIGRIVRQRSEVAENILRVAVGLPVFLGLLQVERIVWGITPETDFQVCAAFAVVGIVAYGYCSLAYYRTYNDIVSVNVVRTLIIASIAAFFILRASGFAVPYAGELSVLTVYLFFVYWLAKNQRNIDFMMERRQHDLKHLPPRIRFYNVYLLLVFFVIALLALLLRGPVMELFRMGAKLFQRMLLNCVPTESGGTESTVVEDATPTPTPDGFSDVPPNYDWLWNTLGILLLVAMVVVFGPMAWRSLKAFLRDLSRKVLSAIRRRHRKAGDRTGESDEYSDAEETLSGEEKTALSRQTDSGRLRMWKKEVRRYRHMPPGEEKYREGYRLVLEGMALKNLPVQPSDTPLEATEKIRQRLATVPQMESATLCYDEIRYALHPADTDTGRLDSILRVLETMKPLPKEEGRLS